MLRLIFIVLFLLVSINIHAQTNPIRFDVGDLKPRGRVEININPELWPGYINIKCDIHDVNNGNNKVIIHISSNMNLRQKIILNDVKFDLPFQTMLSKKLSTLSIYGLPIDGSRGSSSYLTIHNADDEDTISIKNCAVTPGVPEERIAGEVAFCPSKIECLEEGNLSSCKTIGGDPQYWGDLPQDRPIEKGTYTFNYASYRYESPATATAWCVYLNRNSKNLFVTTKSEAAYLEPLHDNFTQWNTDSTKNSTCGGSFPEYCPLTRIAAFGFIGNNANDNISVNGIYIQPISVSNSAQQIIYERAKDACYGRNPCVFDVNSRSLNIGNIIVDMDKKMKILQINSKLSTGYQIKQIEGLNTIKIVKLN